MTTTPTTTPTTEVAIYAQPRTPAERFRYAQSLADARQLPPMLRGSVADVLLRIEYGIAIGVPPISALTAVHIVDGKPTASAGLISGLIRAAGHRLRLWTEPDPDAAGQVRAICEIVRKDDPEFVYRSVWTVQRAVEANLLRRTDDGWVAVKDKSGWATYRANMLKSRALTECGRDACEDVLLGVASYTPEELGAAVDASGEPVDERVDYPVPAASTPPAPDAGPGTLNKDGAIPMATTRLDAKGHPVGPTPDAVRDAMLNAISKADLPVRLAALGLAKLDGTRWTYDKGALTGMVVADENGTACTGWELLAKVGPTLPDETDVVEAVVVEDPPEDGPPATPPTRRERYDAEHKPDYDPWATPAPEEK